MPNIDDATERGLIFSPRRKHRGARAEVVVVSDAEAVVTDNIVTAETVTRERGSLTYNAYSITVHPGDLSLLVSEDGKRSRVIIRAIDRAVIVGRSSAIQSLSDISGGFYLASGTELITEITEAIYVAVADQDGLAGVVSVWLETDA